MKGRLIRAASTVVPGLAMMTFVSLNAHAGAFAVREQSAVGQGMAFAGEGTPSMGLSAIFWNPAAVTRTTGTEGEVHAAGLFPDLKITTLPSTSPALLGLGSSSVDTGRTALLGSIYAAYQYDPNLFFGVALTAPFGQKTVAPLPWPGQNLSVRAEAASFEGNPIVGYKFNDMISAAVGLRVTGASGKISRALAPSPTAPNVAELDISGVGVGWNAGVTVTPWAGTEIALGYRSALNINLDGQTTLPPVAPLPGVFNISGNIPLPDQANLGLRQRITDSIALLGTVEWQNWSRLQDLPFTFTSGPATGRPATTLAFAFRDAWYLAVGGEYRLLEPTTLRAGIGYEITPVTDAVRDPTVPYNDGWRFSLGVTHEVTPAITLDLGYSYIMVNSMPINVAPGHPDSGRILFRGLGQLNYFGSAGLNVSIASLALRYRF